MEALLVGMGLLVWGVHLLADDIGNGVAWFMVAIGGGLCLVIHARLAAFLIGAVLVFGTVLELVLGRDVAFMPSITDLDLFDLVSGAKETGDLGGGDWWYVGLGVVALVMVVLGTARLISFFARSR